MEIAGYILSVLIGISLALIGGGGSILTVPLLVYFFHIEAATATSYSLLVVGITAIVAVVLKARYTRPNYRTALAFGLPSIAAVIIARRFIVTAIPDTLLQINGIALSKNTFIMLLFVVVMFAAAISMIRNKVPTAEASGNSIVKLMLLGVAVGIVTGVVGVGGGFLIIPALVLYAAMDFSKAVATSLLIIAVSSLAGFAGSVHTDGINLHLLLKVIGAACAGILIGTPLANKIESKKLKPAFGWFVVIVSVLVVYKEFANLFSAV